MNLKSVKFNKHSPIVRHFKRLELIAQKISYIYLMLLQLENTNEKDINKLLKFAKQNQLELSLVDDNEDNYFLPGKPLSEAQLAQLIERSRKSGSISLEDAHTAIRNSFNAD